MFFSFLSLIPRLSKFKSTKYLANLLLVDFPQLGQKLVFLVVDRAYLQLIQYSLVDNSKPH